MFSSILDKPHCHAHSLVMESNDNKSSLEDFILNRMRMSHIYQPVMIQVLLKNNGSATLEQAAQALLEYDTPQIDYYTLRTKNMVGKVLTNNGVVEPIKDGRQITGYRLTEATHTDAQRAALQAMCDEAIALIHKQAWWSHMGP